MSSLRRKHIAIVKRRESLGKWYKWYLAWATPTTDGYAYDQLTGALFRTRREAAERRKELLAYGEEFSRIAKKGIL